MTEIKVGDQYCHDRLRFYAKIVGQSTAMSGQGIFIGDYYLSEPQPYDIAPGQTTVVGAECELDWSSDPQGTMAPMPNDPNELKEHTIKMGFNLANANGTVVVEVPKKPYTIRCRKVSRNPMAVQAIGDHDDVTAAPRPPPGSPAAPRLRLAPQAAQPTAPTAPRRLQPRPQVTDEPTAPLRRMQRLRLQQ